MPRRLNASPIACRRSRSRLRYACAALGLALLAAPTIGRAAAAPPRIVLVVPIEKRISPADDLFLAALPAAMAACGRPLVCAVQADSPWRPELLDYLRRYRPQRIVWVGPSPRGEKPAGLPLEVISANTPADGACALAGAFWRRSARAVTYRPEDRACALAGAVLAARLRIPLFPCASGALPAAVRKRMAALGVSRLLAVGAPALRLPGAGVIVERLADPLAVARCLVRERLKVDYLAVAHPLDGGGGDVPRLSLSAALLAAGRGGAIVPLPTETIWKRRFPAGQPATTPPAGARPSSAGYRTGMVDLHGAARSFVIGQDAGSGKWWAQFDRDGDGRFDGPGEAEVRTGGVVVLGAGRYVVDLDVLENGRGTAVWMTAPTPGDIRDCLQTYRRAVGADPRFLCLVGWPEAVPLAITGDAQGTDTDLVTDHPYAQTDADPFVDVAFARFVAEDAPAGTLLACRGLTLGDIRTRDEATSYATAEWADRNRNPLDLAGLRHVGHHAGPSGIAPGSPLTGVGAIVHDSHSMWTVLGSTYTCDSSALLAPCIVVSSGCSPASLDQDAERRSVAARMLRNGALAFVGNGRRGIAQSALYRSEFWNALLMGQTLGEAHRTALNRSMVAILEKGEQAGGSYRYQQDHVAAYGDPALELGLRSHRASDSAHVETRGTRADVVIPAELKRAEYAPLPEWGCRYQKLWTWNALGLGTEAGWRGGDNYDLDDLLMTAEVRTRSKFVGVEPLDRAQAPLGWTGACYVDEHSDGTRSLYWRCRPVDFDMTTGEVRRQVRRLSFRLRTR